MQAEFNDMTKKETYLTNYNYNFIAFVWHAIFLALMKPFLDTDTIIPAMIIKAGGNEMLIGLATAILVGFSTLFQFFFGSYLSRRRHKKKHLLIAIFLRASSILGLALLFFFYSRLTPFLSMFFIISLITVFSIAGAYGGVSYADLLGKSILPSKRKSLFSLKNLIGAVAFLVAAFFAKKILKMYDFPKNYTLLYLIAGFLLFTASFGYFAVKEKETKLVQKRTFWQFVKILPQELKNNKNLLYFLIVLNTLGLGITSFPFLVSYAKSAGSFSSNNIGNFLILKVVGVVLFSLLVFIFRKKMSYRNLLIVSVIAGAALPIIALFTVDYPLIYGLNFFIAGSIFALFRIAKEGIVIEISNEQNRAIYVGIIGAGSIITAVLPLFAGFLLSKFGYTAVFISVSVIVLSSLFFVRKMDGQIESKTD